MRQHDGVTRRLAQTRLEAEPAQILDEPFASLAAIRGIGRISGNRGDTQPLRQALQG